MPNFRALISKDGTTQGITTADTLIVGDKIDAETGTLVIGGSNADAITIGKSGITTTFLGDVDIQGTANSVGGTTFTSDAIFQGNVTFGNGPNDTVTFDSTTTVISNINFGGSSPTHKITNLANGTEPNDAVNKSQLDALNTGVSSVDALLPLVSSGGANPVISIKTDSVSNGAVLTYNSGTSTWEATVPTPTLAQGGAKAVQYANATTATNFDGDNTKFAFDEAASQLAVGTGTPNETLTVGGRVSIAEGTVPSNTAGYGKLWADSTAKTLHFYDNSVDYLVTPNTVQSLTYDSSVALDFAPSTPPLKTVNLLGDIAFTSSNPGASRNITVRIVGDTVSRNLTSFPAGWTWLGGVVPTVLEANRTAILSLASFSDNDANVVASWSYDGSIADSLQVAYEAGNTITTAAADGDLTVDGDQDFVIGGTVDLNMTSTGGISATALTGSVSVVTTTSMSLVAGSILDVGVSDAGSLLSLGSYEPDFGSNVVRLKLNDDEAIFNPSSISQPGWDFDFRVESVANEHMLFVDASANAVGIGTSTPTANSFSVGPTTALDLQGTVLAKNASDSTTAFQVQNAAGTDLFRVDTTNSKLFLASAATTNTHTFNIGASGTDPAFAIASGGRIHFYDGSAPTNGQILIGNTTGGNFEKSTLTAGAGITITQDSVAGTTTIAANNSGSVTSVGLSTTLSGLSVNNSPVTGSGTLELTGTLGVGGGGTGQTTLTSGALLVGNGNGAVNTVSPGTNGQILSVVSGAWAATSLPSTIDYSTIAITPTTATPGDAALITGAFAKANSQTTARVAGIATASAIKILGIIEDCNFETGLATTLSVGQAVYLSASGNGKLTNTAPSTLGQVVAELGIVALVNEATGGAAAADILWQPKPIVIL